MVDQDEVSRHLALERLARAAAEIAETEEHRVEQLIIADRHANTAWILANPVRRNSPKGLARIWK